MARLFDDASNQYLELDSTPVTANPITMACWFYPDNTSFQQLMFVGDKDNAAHFQGLNKYFASVAAQSLVSSNARATTSTTYTINTWNHACGVWASNSSRIAYLNAGGKVEDTNTRNWTNSDRASIARTGDSTPAQYYGGRLAEAALWNIALTDPEIAKLAAGWSPLFIRPKNLVAYWPLKHDDRDYFGRYNMTPVNGPTFAPHPPNIIYPATSPILSFRG